VNLPCRNVPTLPTTPTGMWRLCSSQIFLRRPFFETRFKSTASDDETKPFSEALRINVLDAFSSGGAQNKSEITRRDFDFSNLYTRLGEKVTMRPALQGRYRTSQSFSQSDFGGTFTFSTLESYLAADLSTIA